MADSIHGNTQLSATKQDLIAAIVQRELKQAAILAPYFTDVSRFAVKGAKTISFPKMESFTAVDRASATAGDATVLASTADQLTLDKVPYLAYIVDPQDQVESVLDYELELAGRAASAQGRFVDSAIITELESVGVATTTAGAAITKAIILEMRKAYLSNFGILSEGVLLINPKAESEMLAIDEFVRADAYGSSNIPNGMIGRVYGLQVVMHNSLSDGQYFVAGKSGLAYGFQYGLTMSEQGANEYGASAKRVAMEQKFGVKGMQIAQAGVAAGKSALVIKDNN